MAKVTHINMSVAHIRAARGLLDWSSTTLAERAGINPVTMRRLESKNQGNENTRKSVYDALLAAGIIFQNSGRPGVRLSRFKMVIELGDGEQIAMGNRQYEAHMEGKRLSELKGYVRVISYDLSDKNSIIRETVYKDGKIVKGQ